MKDKNKLEKYIVDLISASLVSDISKVEIISSLIARYFEKVNQPFTKEINEIVGTYSLRGVEGLNNLGNSPLPIDSDTHLQMASINEPFVLNTPIFNSYITEKVQSFLEEREFASLLLSKGLRPSNSLLLIGPPGTGKTLLANYIAKSLNKKIIVLDLSTSISSLLGKTGHNLKKVLQYAKNSSHVLLLDEFDAIAKRRDDNTDLGEIKRVVNILLMELENWPSTSVLIATSNHPELLDKAIWRRFDHTIVLDLPQEIERRHLLQEYFLELELNESRDKTIDALSIILDGLSAADIKKYTQNVIRKVVLKNDDPLKAIWSEVAPLVNKKQRTKFIKLLQGLDLTIRELSELTGISKSTIHYNYKSK